MILSSFHNQELSDEDESWKVHAESMTKVKTE